MTVSYPDAAQSVNLSPSAVSFYRWIARWHAQTGMAGIDALVESWCAVRLAR